MNEGKGFARRVTLDNLEVFAPLLGQKAKNTQDEDAANQEAAPEQQGSDQKEIDPALSKARSQFSGESLKTNKTARSSGSGAKVPASKAGGTGQPKQGKPAVSTSPATAPQPFATPTPTRKLLWKKQSLSRSDAQQTPAGTNPTGNLKLSQAKFKVKGSRINQRTYFRNIVFAGLNWTPVSGTKEEATADFELIIRGVNYGVYKLVISHDPSRVAGQNNTPTWLHWGKAGSVIRNQNVSGCFLSLYSLPSGRPAPFQIEIG